MAKAILVADDDPDILSIVSMSLETQGYTVYKAANGREAVDLAKQHHPDLVLMDMMMPGEIDCLAPVRRLVDRVALRLERHRHNAQDVGVVVRDQDCLCHDAHLLS